MTAIDLKSRVREVQDFPEPGIGFKDIAPLLLDPEALKQTVGSSRRGRRSASPTSCSAQRRAGSGSARRSPLRSGCGFVPARRPGKLPPETVTARYLLEYGENALEVASDAISQGARVVIHDDVLATGGTVEAIAGLVEQLGGHVVGINFVIELSFLEGRKRLGGYDISR